MTYGSTFKLLPIAALVLAAYGTTAQATTTWVGTESHAVDVSNATAGPMFKAGESINIAVSLKVRNKADLDAKTESVVAGRSAPLTTTEFLTQFAPSKDQVDAVVAHLKNSGYVNIQVAPNRLLVTADGTAGSAKQAFNVDIQHFNVKGREAHAAINDVVVPKELDGIVLAVHGLQTVHMAHTFKVSADKVSASSGSEVGHSPAAWPTIYNAGSIPTAANTTIGIVTAGSLTQTLTDLATFAKGAGFAMPKTSTVSVGSGSASSSSGPTEWDIDSQDSLGSAGGVVKSMIFYNAPNLSDANLTAEYNAAVSSNAAKVINVSLGECETSAKSAGTEAAEDQIFETGTAQGQVFAVATGDSGAYECSGSSKVVQSYPAVSPYVIAVGGTTVYTTSAGAWSSETVWACSSSKTCQSNGGTGGGASTTESAPSWQISSGVLGTSKARGVPDIAFDGNPSSGTLAIVNGASAQWGGTSLATPIFVGFWARIQSAHSNSLVYPATALYKFGKANESTIFHDITSGSNGGSSAKAGWDYTSGFGSLNVGPFATFVNNNAGF